MITLSIIGIIAALTIPSLIAKNQEKETVVRVKKAFNTFSNSFTLAKSEYGTPEEWGKLSPRNSLEGAMMCMDKLSMSLNIAKRCDGTKGCFLESGMYKLYNGADEMIWNDRQSISSAILDDGTSFHIFYEGKQGLIATINLDINGAIGPNTWGKDVFALYLTPEGIFPEGLANDTYMPIEKCLSKGRGCAAWVLLKENTQYPLSNVAWE